jgi:hypothetical protein
VLLARRRCCPVTCLISVLVAASQTRSSLIACGNRLRRALAAGQCSRCSRQARRFPHPAVSTSGIPLATTHVPGPAAGTQAAYRLDRSSLGSVHCGHSPADSCGTCGVGIGSLRGQIMCSVRTSWGTKPCRASSARRSVLWSRQLVSSVSDMLSGIVPHSA